jgi:two-component system response regulator AtoC
LIVTKSERKVLIWEQGGDIEIVVKMLGYAAQSVRDGDMLVQASSGYDTEISAVIIGSSMSDEKNVDVLRTLRAADTRLPIIVAATPYTTKDVVLAVRSGATDYIGTPVDAQELASALAAAVEDGCAQGRLTSNHGGPARVFRSVNSVVHETESRIGEIGWSGVPVLIQGETGSGKEVLARKLHAQSARASKPFLKLNCAALPSELVESELFGYERGAFTGAFERKSGIFELADGGTILLDEIGDMDIRLQAKLLQVLQDQEFRRIGGKDTVKVNVRIIAATHRDLEKAIEEKAFREDLYYRLNVVLLQVPALRERTEDIVSLGEFLVRKHVNQSGPVPQMTADLKAAMVSYRWPGNVRELENYMRKLAVFRDPDGVARDLRSRMTRKPPASVRSENQVAMMEKRDDTLVLENVSKLNRQTEIDAILAALNSTRWNRKLAAAVLKVDYKSLLYKMKKLHIGENPVAVPEMRPVSLGRAVGGD